MILPNLNQLALTSASGSSTVTDIIELDSISESNNPFEESMVVIQPELSQFGGSMNLEVSTVAQQSGKSQIIA